MTSELCLLGSQVAGELGPSSWADNGHLTLPWSSMAGPRGREGPGEGRGLWGPCFGESILPLPGSGAAFPTVGTPGFGAFLQGGHWASFPQLGRGSREWAPGETPAPLGAWWRVGSVEVFTQSRSRAGVARTLLPDPPEKQVAGESPGLSPVGTRV